MTETTFDLYRTVEVPTDRERGEPHPYLDQRPEGALYTGPLLPALAEVAGNRSIVIDLNEAGAYRVRLYGSTPLDLDAEDEWGANADLETALRFAVGAFLD